MEHWHGCIKLASRGAPRGYFKHHILQLLHYGSFLCTNLCLKLVHENFIQFVHQIFMRFVHKIYGGNLSKTFLSHIDTQKFMQYVHINILWKCVN